eukprot:586408-Pyramimonas_sp.AAC.1
MHVALDPFLRYLVVTFFCFDWMRVYFVRGILDREVRALTKLYSADDLQDYFVEWTWPSKHHSAATVWETGDFQA